MYGNLQEKNANLGKVVNILKKVRKKKKVKFKIKLKTTFRNVINFP